MRVRIELLGQFRVTIDEREIPADAWRRERGAGLVKLLALSAGHRLHREQAMEAFWPDLDAEAAGANLRKAVHYARRALGEPRLIDSDAVVSLAPNDELAVDVTAFEAAATGALRDRDPAACERAADLYAGELLPDDRYAEWLGPTRTRLQERYAQLLRTAKLWERLVALDPTDEAAQCALMQAALDAGNRAEAIRSFQRLRERLRIDLGVGPKASTIALYESALATPASAPPSVVERARASLAWGLVALQSSDFGKAERIARETRELARGADLAREVGEASTLLGLTAFMQGKWPELFRAELTQWVRSAPSFVAHVFDGHLCMNLTLGGSIEPDTIRRIASELLAAAEEAGSSAGRGLGLLCLGEAELFAGRLEEADTLFAEAEQRLVEVESAAGQSIVLQHQAEIALARGQKWKAGRIAQKGIGIADSSWLRPHLWIRMQGLVVQTATTPEQIEEAVLDGDRTLARSTTCQPCSMGFRAAAAIALAETGELEHVGRRLDEAERLAGMWSGGPWVAALWEARGVQRRAQGSEDRALAAFGEAAARFVDLGRPVDRARCEARMRGAVART